MKVKETPLERTMNARDVSVTERGQFRSCRRRWELETLDNWTPKTPQWALEFGTGVHEALEVYYEAQVEGDEGDVEESIADALDSFDTWHERVEKEQANLLGGLFTVDAKQELWELRSLGRTMLENYFEFAGDRQEADPWRIVAVEGRGLTHGKLHGSLPQGAYGKTQRPVLENGRFLVPIVHPDTKKCLPGRPYLSGRIDLLIRKGTRGDLYVVDHKTTASEPNDRGIDFEDQITGYSYMVWRLTGVLPRGTIFNYLVKKEPKEPRMTQKGLSTAKDQLCLARDYRAALLENGLMTSQGVIDSEAHAECYSALLSKGWNPYFKRFEVARNAHEVDSFEHRLYQEYIDMRATARDRVKAYPNLSAWNCPSCSVAPICQAIEDGSDVAGIIEGRFMQGLDRKAQR